MKKYFYLTCGVALLYSFNVKADVFSLPIDENILYENNHPLNEYIIYDANKKCAMHYLAPFAIADNLTFQILSENSGNICLEKGFAEVQILDIHNNIVQTIEGYFLNGFFIGNLPLNSHAIKRTADANGKQYLYYSIDKNEELGINYIGRMSSYEKDGIYSAFNACPVFEIFLQTQNKALFKEQSTIQNLFTVVKSYAQTICPEVETIVFAATDSPSLSNDGIFFQEYLNKDNSTALWYPDMTQSFNYVLSEPQKEINKAEDKKPILTPQPIKKEKTSSYSVHISDKTNAKVLFIDKPYLMKSKHNKTTRTMKKNTWYQIEADLSPMSDLEKKRSGISLNEKAALIEIHAATECKKDNCVSGK